MIELLFDHFSAQASREPATLPLCLDDMTYIPSPSPRNPKRMRKETCSKCREVDETMASLVDMEKRKACRGKL